MAFENIQDQIKERATEIWEKIQASTTYNGLRERYEALTPITQTGILFGIVLLVTLSLLSIPYTYYSSSTSAVESFDQDRNLIRSLLRASRLASEAANAPQAITVNDLKERIQNDIPTYNLLPEQVGGVTDLDNKSVGGSLASPPILQEAVGLSLKKLNLKQILDIGLQLQGLNPSVKVIGMDIAASGPDNHYFDVVYKLVAFSLPGGQESSPTSNSGASPKGKGGGLPNRPEPKKPIKTDDSTSAEDGE